MADITIIMPTYNKEKYITKALDSIFAQSTSYDYHIIVADDCSTDRTIDIVCDYQKKYPEKITLLKSNTNQKLYKNVLRAYEITKTDYFCVLDPDDEWINPKHLQNALDFLNNHKDYTIYSTHLIKKYEDKKEELVEFSKKAVDSTFLDGLNLKATIASTQTVVYRNVIFKNGIPTKMLNLETKTQEASFRGDSFRNWIHLKEGKAHYEPTIDSIYNITNEGIWTTLTESEQSLSGANLFKDLWLYYDKKYIELLCISKRLYLKVDDDIFNTAKLTNVLDNIRELKKHYFDFQKDIDKYYLSKPKPKVRIFYFLYKKLHKYLSRKGIV